MITPLILQYPHRSQPKEERFLLETRGTDRDIVQCRGYACSKQNSDERRRGN